MSYQVLARKWRPSSFASMVGQSHVLKVLQHALEQQRLHHAYLFTGTRGVGKTTLARIFARCVNCEQGPTAEPCGECSNCKDLLHGQFPDLIEVDAASRAKVDETRELMDNVQYKPAKGRYKVYLIDEVHMFSRHSFNALLKTLEEPPPYVIFLLATTEAKKIPITVLSRCLQLNLRHLEVEQIAAQLEHILQSEKIEYDTGAVQALAHAAEGSMRDGLSLLDQAIAHASGSLQEDMVRQMIGTVDVADLQRLVAALIEKDGASLLAVVAEMHGYSPDYFSTLSEILSLLQKAALVQWNARFRKGVADNALVEQLADALDQETLQLYYQIALKGYQDLQISPRLREAFEMIMIRMIAFRPLPESDTAGVNVESSATGANAVTTEAATTAVDDRQASARVQASSAEEALLTKWRKLLQQMNEAGDLSQLGRQLAERCRIIDWDEQQLRLGVSKSHTTFAENEMGKNFISKLREYLKPCKLDFSMNNDSGINMIEKDQEIQDKTLARERERLRKEPELRELNERFGAQIDDASLEC